MTGKSDFTDEEWQVVLEAPPSAGLMVITAQSGGMLRETFSMAKAYGEARQRHGESELLDEIVSAKPQVDHTRYSSTEQLKEAGLTHLRNAVALLETKAGPEEVEEYRRFIVGLAERVAERHKGVSDAERTAISEIAEALGTEAPG
jgi:hypothetical protein